MLGNYGNEIDGVTKPKMGRRKKDGGSDEESDLIQGSSDEETEDDRDLVSVSTTPSMKPVITDRFGPPG